MYKLGEQFKNNNKLVTAEKMVFRGKNYRISVLTERLVRLEYNPDGAFNNYETTNIKNRFFEMPEFSIQEDENVLKIQTSYFQLTYVKNASFSSRTLSASRNEKTIWNYGQNEVRNLGGTIFTLDGIVKHPEVSKGLFALDGIATINDTNSLCFDEESNVINNPCGKNYIDLYLFIYNKDFGMCLNDFFKLTGMPPMIPRYILGNWWSREYNYNEQDVLDLIDKFHRHNIPLSVFLLDNGWSKIDEKYPSVLNSFSFNKGLFPNPIEFINKVHEKKIKIGVKVNPQNGFHSVEDNFEMASKYLALNEKGYIDFNPYNMKNIDVLLKIFLHPLEKSGIDIIWNDYYEKDKNKMYLINYYLHKDHALDNKRNVILSRNSMVNAHLNNIIYSGRNIISWDVLKMLPKINLTASNIGASFYSHDVGGSVEGIEESDLYIRSIQFGVFSPILRFNTQKGKYFKRAPWDWDVVTEQIASDYLRLRHKLIPYIYTEAYHYHKDGKVLVKPFYYYNIDFYDDSNYVNQYYFGSSFMISPIINPMDEIINRTIQKFYIPKGVWYDFKTGKRFLGNHKYVAFYPISDYPIFVKQGCIIPMAGDDCYLSHDNPSSLEVHVFPGESNTYQLYEDDGETFEYQNGKYCITELDYNYRKSNYTLIIRKIDGDSSVIPSTRNYKIVFRNTKQSENVIVYENDRKLDDIQTEVTDTDFIVYINNISTSSQLTINCYGEDIEIDSVKLIKDDIDSILSDLKIYTVLKDEISKIVFNDELTLGKKRIAIRKLRRKGLDSRSIKVFLRLLDYMEM